MHGSNNTEGIYKCKHFLVYNNDGRDLSRYVNMKIKSKMKID